MNTKLQQDKDNYKDGNRPNTDMAAFKRALDFSGIWSSTPNKAEKKAKHDGESMHLNDNKEIDNEEYEEASERIIEDKALAITPEPKTHENKMPESITLSKSQWDQLIEKLDKLDKIDKMAWEVESLKDSLNYHTKQVDDLTKSQICQGKEINHLTKQMKKLELQNDTLKRQLLETQAEQMRENLMAFGIQEDVNPQIEECEEKIKAFIEKELQVPIEEIDINKAYRIGKRPERREGERTTTAKPRPIVIKFRNQKVRDKVKKASHKLKGTTFGLGDQFPKEIADTRKALFPILRQAKAKGKQAYIKLDKLYIDGQLYVGED